MCRRIVRWSWEYIPKNVRVWVSRELYVLLWVDRSGRVYAGRCRQFVAGDAGGQKAEVMSSIWEGPMRRKTVEQLAGARVHASTAVLVDTHPNLAEFLTAATFEGDGKTEPREAPTVTVWCAGGLWRASIKDRAEGLVCWISAESWAELWQMADLFVLDDSTQWRHDEGMQKGKRAR